MSLKYILGGAGSGKTALMLGQIADTLAKRAGGQDAALIYIVPEQFTLQSEKALCLSAGGAVMSAQVLSFQRFAYRLFAESGGGKGVFLDDAAKRMLLRRIIYESEKRDPLSIFASSADKPGFLENLSHTFTEFLLCGVTAESLRHAAAGGGQTFRNKLGAVCDIYENYIEALGGVYISAETALDLVPGKVLESRFLEGARVWIDGFLSFSQKEYKIIESLLLKAESVTAAFTIGRAAVSFDINEYDKCREVMTAINTITRLADINGIEVERPVFLEKNRRFKKDGLAFLERHLLSNTPKAYPGAADDSIHIYAAANIYDEAEQAARRIHGLAARGWRYGEIAVVCGDVAAYERPLSNALRGFDIPFFFDIRRDVLSHPLVELIRAAVDVTAQNRTYESVFRFLKTGLAADGLGIPRETADTLENYALEYGIRGGRWAEEWTYGAGEGGYDLAAVNDARQRVNACFERFLKPGRKSYIARASVKQYAALIFELLEELNISEALESQAERLALEGDFAAAAASGQIYGKVCRLFERMVDMLGGIEYDIGAFARILQAGFSAVDTGEIPHTLDQVAVGDAERSRFPDIRALLVLGVNEGVLPFYGEDAGVFTHDERLELAAGGVELTPGADMNVFTAMYSAYMFLTKPSERLYLSYARADKDGRAAPPSVIISTVRRMFPNLAPDEPLRTPGRPAPRLTAVENSRIYTSLTDRLYNKTLSTSVSRLELYAQCPFAYFMSCELGVRERRLYELAAPDIGGLFHDVLSRFTKLMAESGLSWRDADFDAGFEAAALNKCIDESAARLKNEIMFSSAQYKYAVEKIRRISRQTLKAIAAQLRQGSFEILATEFEFGNAPGARTAFELEGGRRVTLMGRVDRVDAAPAENGAGEYIKIIDYKMGGKRFDKLEQAFGLQLQLIVYLDAICAELSPESENALPACMFYFGVQDPIISLKTRADDPSAGDADKIEQEILKKFRMSGIACDDAGVIRAMDGGLPGRSNVFKLQIKKDGGLGANSDTVSREELELMRAQARQKVRELARDIFEGNIAPFPYRKKSGAGSAKTGCDYCEYGAVCGFEAFGGRRFNEVK